MATWSELRGGGLSLEKCVKEYSAELGITTYPANNPCVERGFQDAQNEK